MKKLIAAAVAALALTSSACNQAKNVGPALINCAKQDLTQVVGTDGLTLLTQVATILMSGGTGWQAELEQLGAKVGVDALACSVLAVETILGAQAPAGAGSGSAAPSTSSLAPPLLQALQRAREYHAAKGWHFE